MEILEKLCNCTTRINFSYNEHVIHGTAFFFRFEKGKVYLVTNFHVAQRNMQNGDSLEMTLDLKEHINGVYNSFSYVIPPNTDWICHPSNDLAILPFEDKLDDIRRDYKDFYFFPLSEYTIPTKNIISNFSVMESLIMIGYPDNRIVDETAFPLIRQGVSATPLKQNCKTESPAEGIKNYDSFFVDIPTYGGSSGSPVFVYNLSNSTNADKFSSSNQELYFVGIISDNCIHRDSYNGYSPYDLKKETPIITSEISSNIGIGIAIKSYKMLDFKNYITPEK